MYHGKYHTRPALFPPWRWNRQRLILTAAILLTLLAAAVTAWLLSSILTTEKNRLWYEGSGSRIQEEVDGARRSNVAITNTGDTNAFFRAAVIITWRDSNGNLCREIPVEGMDYEIVYGSGWVSAGGYYYWQGAVSPGKSTGSLIESFAPLRDKIAEDGVYTLSVEVLADAVQCIPDSAAAKVWGAHAAELVGAGERLASSD